MLTLKFGGTSMGSAARILNSADIVIGRAEKDRVSVVVSAVAGQHNKMCVRQRACRIRKKRKKNTLGHLYRNRFAVPCL